MKDRRAPSEALAIVTPVQLPATPESVMLNRVVLVARDEVHDKEVEGQVVALPTIDDLRSGSPLTSISSESSSSRAVSELIEAPSSSSHVHTPVQPIRAASPHGPRRGRRTRKHPGRVDSNGPESDEGGNRTDRVRIV